MASRVAWTSFVCACALIAGAGSSSSRATDSDPECNVAYPAVDSASATATISPVGNPQASWQRMGRELDIKIDSGTLPAKQRVRVCVAWKINQQLSSGEPIYFVPASVTHAEPDAKGKGLKITAVVPELDDAPDRFVKQGQNVGVYAQNNAFPIARVRTLLYDDKTVVLDKVTDFGVIAGNVFCDYPFPATTAGSGILTASDRKNWQPSGGELVFSVKTTRGTGIPPDALVKVCFRWILDRGDNPGPFVESGPTRIIERNPDSLKVSAMVPHLGHQPPRFRERDLNQSNQVRQGRYAIPYIAVPLADVRVLVFDNSGFPIVDVPTSIGITSYWFALTAVAVTLGLAFSVLMLAWRNRLSMNRHAGPLLCIITNSRGDASLSQFQIMLWTFVVAASTVYVFALSGELIEITNGTLILLGISGASGVASKIKTEKDAAAEPPVLTPQAAAAEAEAAKARAEAAREALRNAVPQSEAAADALAALKEAEAKATAAALAADAAEANSIATKARIDVVTTADKAAAEAAAKEAELTAAEKNKLAAKAAALAQALTRKRHPRWSDLVMEESQGREIDVARVQMLYFTLITAVFVLVRVLTSFAIPDIPEGFMVLMGISNSVYVGAKFAGGTSAK